MPRKRTNTLIFSDSDASGFSSPKVSTTAATCREQTAVRVREYRRRKALKKQEVNMHITDNIKRWLIS